MQKHPLWMGFIVGWILNDLSKAVSRDLQQLSGTHAINSWLLCMLISGVQGGIIGLICILVTRRLLPAKATIEKDHTEASKTSENSESARFQKAFDELFSNEPSASTATTDGTWDSRVIRDALAYPIIVWTWTLIATNNPELQRVHI